MGGAGYTAERAGVGKQGMHRPDVTIIGAGFSGALTALNVLAARGSRARVHLVEQAERFGVGVAFGARQQDHLLNVRAANMSADPDRPDDFAQWLAKQRGRAPEPYAFASRAEYGAYVQERLRKVAQAPSAADRLDLVADQVVAVHRRPGGYSVELAMGRAFETDAVVLATGNAPPSTAVLPDGRISDDERYVADPWAPGGLDAIGEDDPVLLLGSGLTMVDVMASLQARGHRGPVTAISRRGLLPQPHAPAEDVGGVWRRLAGETLSAALNRFRREADGGDWRGLFDSLRPLTQDYWRSMTLTERRRFLRHLRPWWEVHRHRLAPAMDERLTHWRSSRLEIVAARLASLKPCGADLVAAWRPRASTQICRRRFRAVVNCTGPEGDPRQSRSLLIRQLLANGQIRPDAMTLGMDATEDGQLIGAGGEIDGRLFAIGPPARGALWEVTAVPDIRIEARRLGRVLSRLGVC